MPDRSDIFEPEPGVIIRIVAGDAGVRSVAFGARGPVAEPHPLVDETVRQLREYFAGERWRFDLPLDLTGTPFQTRVWRALEQIPYGETRSYRDIAEGIGAPAAVRAVGAANGANPIAIIVPCHRVVGAGGKLTGYGGGLPLKQSLLALEAKNAWRCRQTATG